MELHVFCIKHLILYIASIQLNLYDIHFSLKDTPYRVWYSQLQL